MLVESELPVKIEPKIPPVGLGFEWCITSVRGVPEVYTRELLVSARKMEELCFVMFQSEAGPCKEVEQNAVR